MKKTLFLLAAVALSFVACSKDDSGSSNTDSVKELTAEVNVRFTSDVLAYGQPNSLSVAVNSDEVIDKCSAIAVKKEGETYTEVGEVQTLELSEAKASVDQVFHAEYFADSKDMTDIAVTVNSGKLAKTVYFPVKVEGELPGTVWIDEKAFFTASPKVATHENNPDLYPNANTGAGCDEPSFFSMHGMNINGEVKHIVSLSEARPLDGKDLSFVLCNVLENTSKAPNAIAYIGSQRGFVFCDIATTTAGTIGRQCDAYNVDGHDIKKAAELANFKFCLVRGSWKVGHFDENDAAAYDAVSRLNNQIKSANTNLEKMKAFWALGEIQRTMDTATLPNELPEGVDPTSLKVTNMLRQFIDLGPTAKNAPNEQWRAGDFIILRSKRGEQYYYGIMQIRQVPDITACLNADTGRADNIEGLNKLFGQKLYVSIKCQCEVPAVK